MAQHITAAGYSNYIDQLYSIPSHRGQFKHTEKSIFLLNISDHNFHNFNFPRRIL